MAINSFKRAGLANTNTIEMIAPPADFSNTPTGTYSDSGINYKYIQYNSSSTLTITSSGIVDLFMIGGGGTGYADPGDAGNIAGGGAGGVINREYYLVAGTYTVTVGAAANSTSISLNSLAGNSIIAYQGASGSHRQGGASGNNQTGQGYSGYAGYVSGGGGGAGGAGTSSGPGPSLSISLSGTSVSYGAGGKGYNGTPAPTTANRGHGGNSGSAGTSGTVIVRVKV